MTRWFRVYAELIDDPKFIKLGPDLRSALLTVWCIAAANDGKLPALDYVAIKFRLSEGRTRRLLEELERCGFIDRDTESTALVPHNWDKRQFKSDVSNDRVKRHRERKCNVTSTVTETPPENREQKQRTETEKKDARESALLPAMQAFWSIWPNKVGKPAALRALRSALERATISEICEGAERYIRDKPPDRPWLNPATFLNQNRWEDQPAKVETTNGNSGEISSAADKLIDELKRGYGGAPPQEHFGSGAHEASARLLSYRRGE